MANRTFKLAYHLGDQVDLKTKMSSGKASIKGADFVISNDQPHIFPLAQIREIEMLRLHGLGRLIRLRTNKGTLFMSVVRVNLFGYFVIANFVATGRLYKLLREAAG